MSHASERLANIMEKIRQSLSRHGFDANRKMVADAIDVSPTIVTRYFQGKINFDEVRTGTLKKIAEAAGVSIDTLVRYIDGKSESLDSEESPCHGFNTQDPVQLASRLVELLSKQQSTAPDPLEGVRQLLHETREALGEERVALLASMILDGSDALQAVDQGGSLTLEQARALYGLLGAKSLEPLCALGWSQHEVKAPH